MLDNILLLLYVTVEDVLVNTLRVSGSKKIFMTETVVKAISDSLKRNLLSFNTRAIAGMFSDELPLESHSIVRAITSDVQIALARRFDVPDNAMQKEAVAIVNTVANVFSARINDPQYKDFTLDLFVKVFVGGRKVFRNNTGVFSVSSQFVR